LAGGCHPKEDFFMRPTLPWFLAMTVSLGALAAHGASITGTAGTPTRPGKLDLAPCKVPGLPDHARCGTYEVFENRATKSGRRIPLRVAVLPANAPRKQPDAIAYFSGGPGESAVQEGVWLADVLRQQGAQTRDVLLVDLRGTGGSDPLECPDMVGTQGVQGFLDNFVPTEGARACYERLSKTRDLTQYTTEIAVDDVDEVRAALGYDRLNLVGGSYGTRSELIYMRRHPDRVRTATLSRVVANDAATPLQFARITQNALDGLIAECAGDAECHKTFPRLREEVSEILQRTEKEPVRVGMTDAETGKPFELRFNRNGVAQTLRYMLYSTDTAAQLPLFVHLAAQGDFKPLAGIARNWGNLSMAGYFLAVTCAEDVPFIREEQIASAVAGTFLGDFRIRQQQAACKAWKAAKLGPGFQAPTVSDAPTLIVSGERDPATPASDGEKTVRNLRHGVHVVVADGAHSNNGMKGRECEEQMMVKLIETGSTERLDTSCVAGMERPAFALSVGDPEVTLAAADLNRLAGTYRNSEAGFEVRFDVVDGKHLRATYSDGGGSLFVPTSPVRFREAYGGLGIVFRLEEGRPAGVGLLRSGERQGPELTRVP
jgi:pimeloyl-ACP methyl ester carboxylesterase